MAVNLNIRFANTDFLAPKVRRAGEAAFQECKEAGYELDWFETWRSLARQEWLYAQGRTRPGKIVTSAVPGKSTHFYGLAIDPAFKNRGVWTWDAGLPYDKVVSIFMSHGFEEPPSFEKFHFQMTSGFSIDHIARIARDEGLFAVWAKLELL